MASEREISFSQTVDTRSVMDINEAYRGRSLFHSHVEGSHSLETFRKGANVSIPLFAALLYCFRW